MSFRIRFTGAAAADLVRLYEVIVTSFEIENATTATALAVRHQREDNYH